MLRKIKAAKKALKLQQTKAAMAKIVLVFDNVLPFSIHL